MVLPSRRKQFKFAMPPNDNELWAIGAIAVQWSQLETLITAFVHALLDDLEKRKVFDTTRAVDQRLDQWQMLVEQEILPQFQSPLLALIRKVKDAKFQRDRVMHGTWTGTHVDVEDTPTASKVFNWGPTRKPFEWDLNFGKLMKLALLIDECICEIVNLTHIGRTSSTEFLTLGNGLQHLRLRPHQR